MRFFILLLALCLHNQPLVAAEVELLGGKVLEVEILKETDTHLTIRQTGVRTGMQMPLPKKRIARYRADSQSDWVILQEQPNKPKKIRKSVANPQKTKTEKTQGKRQVPSTVHRYFGFRGDHTGHFTDTMPPTTWQAPLWTTVMNNKSSASPVLAGDELILCCDEPHDLVALDLQTGQERWRRSHPLSMVGSDDSQGHQTKWFSTYGWTTPTPVVQGNHVWVSFGHGIAACYDLNGEQQWIKKLQVSGKSYMTAASGCLVGDTFICYMAKEDWQGSVYGIDAKTGAIKWQQTSRISQGSLSPLQLAGEAYVILAVGDVFRVKDGKKVRQDWHGMGKKGRNYGPTPVWDSDTGIIIFPVYNGTKEGDKPMRAIKLDLTAEPQLLWEYISDPEPHYSGRMHGSPLIVDGIFYARRQDGFLFALDVATGKEHWTTTLPGQNFSSLVRAGEFIYAFGKKEVCIFKPGPQYEEVARFPHGFGTFTATPVFRESRLYVRDAHGLHAYGPR